MKEKEIKASIKIHNDENKYFTIDYFHKNHNVGIIRALKILEFFYFLFSDLSNVLYLLKHMVI